MTTGQLIAIIVAIVTSNGLWAFIENRFNRKDKLADTEQKSIEDFEYQLEMCSDACKKMLSYILIPWTEHVVQREEEFVGIHEYEVMSGLISSATDLGLNGVLEHRWGYIDTYKRVPDVDIDNERSSVV